MSRRICLALDLKDDPALIEAYERWHQVGNVPPEVIDSIRVSGIENMEIFRAGTRMFMVIDANDSYSAEEKGQMDAANPHVIDWDRKMRTFQQPIPAAGPDGSWIEMERVFRLTEHRGTDGKTG